MVHALHDQVTAEQVADLAPGLRRYASTRHWDPSDVDDLVQETLARLLEVHTRLGLDTLFVYALTVQNNLDRSKRRGDDVARRHRHRLLDLDGPTSADDEMIRAEQREALGRPWPRSLRRSRRCSWIITHRRRPPPGRCQALRQPGSAGHERSSTARHRASGRVTRRSARRYSRRSR